MLQYLYRNLILVSVANTETRFWSYTTLIMKFSNGCTICRFMQRLLGLSHTWKINWQFINQSGWKPFKKSDQSGICFIEGKMLEAWHPSSEKFDQILISIYTEKIMKFFSYKIFGLVLYKKNMPYHMTKL